MGSINSVPVVSQIKSLVQVISGDAEGAKRTQEDFARKGIVVSQVCLGQERRPVKTKEPNFSLNCIKDTMSNRLGSTRLFRKCLVSSLSLDQTLPKRT